jgi:GntR family transcriptional regulator
MAARELMGRLTARLRAGGAGPASQLITEEIWVAVVEGDLDVGARLPTSRELAIALGVSPRSIERAYEELERRGVVVTRQGAGTFVSLAPASDAERVRYTQFAALCAEAVQRSVDLGFDVDTLIDALSEFRAGERTNPSKEPGS